MPLKSGSTYSMKGIKKSLDLNTKYDVLPSSRWCDHASSFGRYRSFDVMLKKSQPRSYFASVELVIPDQVLFCWTPSTVCSGGTWQSLYCFQMSVRFCFVFPPTKVCRDTGQDKSSFRVPTALWTALEAMLYICRLSSVGTVIFQPEVKLHSYYWRCEGKEATKTSS